MGISFAAGLGHGRAAAPLGAPRPSPPSPGHADALDLLAGVGLHVEDAPALPLEVGAEDVDREALLGADDLDTVDVVRRQQRVGRAVRQHLVNLLLHLAVAGAGAVVEAAVAGGALLAGVD